MKGLIMSNIRYNENGPDVGDLFDFFGVCLALDDVRANGCSLYDSTVFTIDAHLIKPDVSINPFGIKRVIFNGPATIVFWTDNTKTVVKCAEEEIYNKRTAIMWAIMKKIYGNSSRVNKAFDKLIKDAESTNDEDFVDIKIDIEKLIKDATKNFLNSNYGVNTNRK